mmetsp:Transcript_6842/g.9990  ORF Transcript_6842/g.9990 Transcript_6842/m.9990 type:complete len:314 (-) Transcript_6842:37-978(-)
MRVAPNLTTIPLVNLREYYELQKRHCDDMLKFLDGSIAQTLKHSGSKAVYKSTVKKKKKKKKEEPNVKRKKQSLAWKDDDIKSMITVLINADAYKWKEAKENKVLIHQLMEKFDRTETSINRKVKILCSVMEDIDKHDEEHIAQIIEQYRTRNRQKHTTASTQAIRENFANNEEEAEYSMHDPKFIERAEKKQAILDKLREKSKEDREKAKKEKAEARKATKAKEKEAAKDKMSDDKEEDDSKKLLASQASQELLSSQQTMDEADLEEEAENLLNDLEGSDRERKKKKKKKKKRKRKKDEEDANERPIKKKKK